MRVCEGADAVSTKSLLYARISSGRFNHDDAAISSPLMDMLPSEASFDTDCRDSPRACAIQETDLWVEADDLFLSASRLRPTPDLRNAAFENSKPTLAHEPCTTTVFLRRSIKHQALKADELRNSYVIGTQFHLPTFYAYIFTRVLHVCTL